MKRFIFFLFFLSSLNGYGQFLWEGDYMLKYEKKKSSCNKSEVKIWKSGDSLKWSFRAFCKDFWLWESSGYCIKTDSISLQLFITNYKNYKPKTQNRTFDKLEKQKPLYLIIQVDKMFYISTVAGRKKQKLELVKQ